MLHEDIMHTISNNPTYGDYIGIALANGWDKVEICETLNTKLGVTWNTVSELVDIYLEKYEEEELPKKLNQKFKKPVMIDGTVYESIKAASQALGKGRTSIEWMLKKGTAEYAGRNPEL